MAIKVEHDADGKLRLVPTDPADDYVTIPLLQYEALMDQKHKEREVITVHEIDKTPTIFCMAIGISGWIAAAIMTAIVYQMAVV